MDSESTQSFARWKQLAAAAGLNLPDSEIEAIAGPLDRLAASIRPVLDAELGFSEPVICLRFPKGEV